TLPLTFKPRPSTVELHHSTLKPQPSAFEHQPSTFKPRPSTVELHHSTFNPQTVGAQEDSLGNPGVRI
ncbi:MAG: hypothetical protein LBJ64_08910, partial [Deltaproteobacteria bacterium]|nr:hypothetical protein [Deltaproteobacteria bacterium]